MPVDPDAKLLQAALEEACALLPAVFGDHDASHIEPLLLIGCHQPEYVGIIGDTKVSADLILLNIFRADRNDDLRLVGQLLEHPQFTVRLEAGKDAGGVIIVE